MAEFGRLREEVLDQNVDYCLGNVEVCFCKEEIDHSVRDIETEHVARNAD